MFQPCRIAVLTVLTAFSVFAQDFEEFKGRTWTSGSGKTIEAELMSYKYGTVTLKSPEGKIFKIPITALVAADREYIKNGQSPESAQSSEPASAGEKVDSKDSRSLPTLSNGTWKKMWDGRRKLDGGKGVTAQTYSIYRHPKFEARVDQDGFMYILFLKDGKPMESTMTIRHPVGRNPNSPEGLKAGEKKPRSKLPDGVSSRRKLVKFTEFPEPSENPSTITLKGIYEDDVSWECTYEFKDNTITYYGKMTSPSSLEIPATHTMGCSFAPSHEFDNKTTIDEQRRQTAHCSLSVVTDGGKKKDADYNYTSPHKIASAFKSIEVKGHFAPHTVRLDAMDADDLPVVNNYTGVALYNGFGVRSEQRLDASSGTYKRRERTPKVKITIK